jgi:hypothetical protein
MNVIPFRKSKRERRSRGLGRRVKVCGVTHAAGSTIVDWVDESGRVLSLQMGADEARKLAVKIWEAAR